MSNAGNPIKPKTKVFISYAHQDWAAAERVVSALRSHQLKAPSVWLDLPELSRGKPWQKILREGVAANSFIVLLLSKNAFSSKWIGSEAASILDELRRRDVTIIPVLLEDCEIPPALMSYRWIDLRTGIEEKLENLAGALWHASNLNFENLTPQVFERLVLELLKRLGFEDIRPGGTRVSPGTDFLAEYRQKDPFGKKATRCYAIETKFYREARADLRALYQLILFARENPIVSEAVLITNGSLTSAALEWLNEEQRTAKISVNVIDGTELKRLLLQFPDLISMYFPAEVSE